jgi:hypothetical protein
MASSPPPDDLWTDADAGIGAVDGFVSQARRRLLRRSTAWWRAEARSGRRRADVVAELVAGLAGSDPASGGRTPPRPKTEQLLADQLAVVAYDVVHVLRERYDPEVAERTAHAIAAVMRDVDPRD